MSLDHAAVVTTADENCTVVQVDVHDTASPAGAAGEKQTRKGVTTTRKGKRLESALVRAVASVNRLEGNPRKVYTMRREMSCRHSPVLSLIRRQCWTISLT